MKSDLMFLASGDIILFTVWKFLRQIAENSCFLTPPAPPFPQVSLEKQGSTSSFLSVEKLRGQLLKSRVFWKCSGRKERMKKPGMKGWWTSSFWLVLGDFISRIWFVPHPGKIYCFFKVVHWYPQSTLAASSVIIVWFVNRCWNSQKEI